MNGAQLLVKTLLAGEVDTCFANPGTSEMHFVAALDKIEGMRCVLGLFEGVVTGAADGYYRIAQKPAATLLHLGPGLANGLANLHNAKKAGSGIINIVGNHAVPHLALDAPLTSDVEGLARPMSHWVKSCNSPPEIGSIARDAISLANEKPAKIATIVLPADAAWSEVDPMQEAVSPVMPTGQSLCLPESNAAIAALKRGPTTLLLLGKRALTADVSRWAGKIAAATGCAVMAEFYGARIERGAGRVALPRLPYAVDPSLKALEGFDSIVLVDAVPPVAFFAYPEKPGRLTKPDCTFVHLAGSGDDAAYILRDVAKALQAEDIEPAGMAGKGTLVLPTGKLTPEGIGQVIASHIPENAIVVDESLTTGRQFDGLTMDAKPHDWLTGTGGSIGFALPVALGAAIAAPDRRVLVLEGDGSAMYTLQALWSMVRENLNITVVIFSNRQYKILSGEFAGVGAGVPGRRATDMLSLDRPDLDWAALSKGMGMPCHTVHTLEQLSVALGLALHAEGPGLIEVNM